MLRFSNEDISARHAERVSPRLRVRRDRFLTDFSLVEKHGVDSFRQPTSQPEPCSILFDRLDYGVDSNHHEKGYAQKSDPIGSSNILRWFSNALISTQLLQNQKYGVGVDAHCSDAANQGLPSRVHARVISPLQLLFKNMILWDLAPEAPSIPQSLCRLVTLQHCIAIPWKRLLRCNYKAVHQLSECHSLWVYFETGSMEQIPAHFRLRHRIAITFWIRNFQLLLLIGSFVDRYQLDDTISTSWNSHPAI